MMTNDQLRARLFTLSANRGPEWGLNFTEDIMQRFGENAWVFSCGAEMLLRNQLPERAESLQTKTINYERPFDNDSPYLATDEYGRGYRTWGDYLRDEAENGFLFECPACHVSLFIWLDCRRGLLDRECAHCGHSHKPVVQAALRQAAETLLFASYPCACPIIQPPCTNPVGASGGLCAYCVQGDHRGHR